MDRRYHLMLEKDTQGDYMKLGRSWKPHSIWDKGKEVLNICFIVRMIIGWLIIFLKTPSNKCLPNSGARTSNTWS